MQQQRPPRNVERVRMQTEGDSPRPFPPEDIFDLMLLDHTDKLNSVEDSPMNGRPDSRRMFGKDNLKKLLKSSSSNQNLMPELRNDSSMDIEQTQNKNFETENSQDDESIRHFKKRAEESFSIEYTSRKEEDSRSESFSERSDSQSHNNNILPRMEEDEARPTELPKKPFQGCNCKRSKCIKLYCECFHLKVFCTELCRCHSCANRKDNGVVHQKAIIEALSRNPQAFEQEFQPPEENPERHANIFSLGVQKEDIKRGCKCKKTKCLKKYCECYSSGQLCSIFCRCEDCSNRTGHPNIPPVINNSSGPRLSSLMG